MLDVTRAAAALTREQKENWDRDGYLILPQFFGADIIDPVNTLIERLSNPGARSAELANRVVIDMLAGAAQSRPGRTRGRRYIALPKAGQGQKMLGSGVRGDLAAESARWDDVDADSCGRNGCSRRWA